MSRIKRFLENLDTDCLSCGWEYEDSDYEFKYDYDNRCQFPPCSFCSVNSSEKPQEAPCGTSFRER